MDNHTSEILVRAASLELMATMDRRKSDDTPDIVTIHAASLSMKMVRPTTTMSHNYSLTRRSHRRGEDATKVPMVDVQWMSLGRSSTTTLPTQTSIKSSSQIDLGIHMYIVKRLNAMRQKGMVGGTLMSLNATLQKRYEVVQRECD